MTLQVVDYWDRVYQTDPAAAAGGQVLALADQVPAGYLWLVDYVLVQNTSTAATVAELYDDGGNGAISHLLDGTSSGNRDVGEWPPNGLIVTESAQLAVIWFGCSQGAVGHLRVQARVMIRPVT